MKKIYLLLFEIMLMGNLLWSQEITNVTASQRTDGSKMLDVTYDLSGTETQCTVTLEISFDDGLTFEPVTQVSGNVGTVAPAIGLQLVWDAAAEFPDGFYSETMKVKVTAEVAASWQCGDILVDSRDSQEYETVQIGEQCWMAENLAYLPGVSPSNQGSWYDPYYYVYGYEGIDLTEAKSLNNYLLHGVLYNWPAANISCPNGWYLPHRDEFKVLEGFVDSQYPIGDTIWDTWGWRGYDAGSNLTSSTAGGFDLYGYSGLKSGYRNNSGFFSWLDYSGNWWAHLTEIDYYAYCLGIGSSSQTSNSTSPTDIGYSVRCLLDHISQNLPPTTPSNPSPENNSQNQSIETTLQWSCSDPENDPLTYDIYFGIENPPSLITFSQTETSYNPSTLVSNTNYYWKIVAHDIQGNTTEGTIWNFATEQFEIEIGQDYQGGIVAYILQPGDPGYVAGETHGLIAASMDQSSSAEWGCNGTSIPGADGTLLGTGYQNTLDIIAGCSQTNFAAKICNNLELNGLSDWYLPSKDELHILYINKTLIGGFANNSYWSSSEFGTWDAWRQRFDNGSKLTNRKDVRNYVRAVRYF